VGWFRPYPMFLLFSQYKYGADTSTRPDEDKRVGGIMTPLEVRKRLGLTQAKMAKKMGVHLHTWIKWERGERNMNAAARTFFKEIIKEIKNENDSK